MAKKKSTKQSVTNLVNNLKDLKDNEEDMVWVEIYHDGSYVLKRYDEDNDEAAEILSASEDMQVLAELAKR